MSSYLGSIVPLSEAFDEISDFNINIKVADSVWGKNEYNYSFNKANLPNKEFVACSNNLCENGGLSMLSLLDTIHSSEKGNSSVSTRCGGTLGRSSNQRCTYRFECQINWVKQKKIT